MTTYTPPPVEHPDAVDKLAVAELVARQALIDAPSDRLQAVLSALSASGILLDLPSDELHSTVMGLLDNLSELGALQPAESSPVILAEGATKSGLRYRIEVDADEHPRVPGARADEPVPFRALGIPAELVAGFVVGHCGHRVSGSEWRAGMRTCERCSALAGYEGEPAGERFVSGIIRSAEVADLPRSAKEEQPETASPPSDRPPRWLATFPRIGGNHDVESLPLPADGDLAGMILDYARPHILSDLRVHLDVANRQGVILHGWQVGGHIVLSDHPGWTPDGAQ